MTRRRHRQRGNAMVEFAIAFPVMALLFTGIYQWGYSLYLYNCLENNVRAGARYAAQKSLLVDPTSPLINPAPASCFVNEVKNMVVYGTPTPASGSAPVVRDLQPGHVQVMVQNDNRGVPQNVTVRISTTQPYVMHAFFGGKRLIGKPSITFPYTGIFSPATPCP